MSGTKSPLRQYPINQSPLYRLSSRQKVAALLGVPLKLLESLARASDSYRVFDIAQNEKLRRVEVPKGLLSKVHKRLFLLLSRVEKPDYLHSGVRGRSYITNAKAHAPNVPLVKVDVKKFYPSVHRGMIFDFFRFQMHCSPDVSGLISALCSYQNHLPTGSAVSQLMAYFAVKPMFDALNNLANQSDLRMTCYVDDLTFSGEHATPRFLWEVKKIIHRFGLSSHKEKWYAATDRKLVTGVLLVDRQAVVQPCKELAMWQEICALTTLSDVEQLGSLNRLVGRANAAAQIEARFLQKVQRLTLLRKATQVSVKSSMDKFLA